MVERSKRRRRRKRGQRGMEGRAGIWKVEGKGKIIKKRLRKNS